MFSFQLDPKAPRQHCVHVYRDSTLIALCSLAERDALLALLGHRQAKAPRLGWSQTGKTVTRRGARA